MTAAPVSATPCSAGDCVIGLDVGGTKIAGGVVACPSGQVLKRRSVATRPERGGDVVLDAVTAVAEELAAEAARDGRTVTAFGVAVAELVDLAENVTSEATIAWRGLPVRQHLSRVAPATVESDVRAAALAEAHLGAGQELDIFLYVTVGTGVSACLMQDGRPYAGARGGALVVSGNPLCIEPGEPVHQPIPLLEEYVAGPALVRRYNQAQRGGPVDRAEDVVAAAIEGDPEAAYVVSTAGTALGAGIAGIVNLLDPQAVIVGGGLGLAGGLFWSRLVATTQENVWAEASRGLPIQPARLGADAGIVGAALSCVRQM